MAKLESDAKPHLLELFSNDVEVVELSEADRFVIARWAVKTALTLNLGSNFLKDVPAEHYKYLYDNPKTLPDRVVVCAQNHHYSGQFYWIQGSASHISDDTDRMDAETVEYFRQHSYKIGFQFRGLLLLVAYSPLKDYVFNICRGIHVPLYPMHGPVSWFEDNNFPWNNSEEALMSFHLKLGFARGV